MRILYFGSGRFGIPCLDAIRCSGHTLAAVFTQPARPAGRHRDLKPTDVAQWCHEKAVPCFESKDINCPDQLRQVADYKADLLVVIAFGQKISQPLVQLFPKGAINIHGSLLPRYRGAAPINWAIIRGESQTGVSVITLADRMDAGLILGQACTPIYPEDDFETLHDRLSELSAPLLIDTVNAIEKGIAVYRSQEEQYVTKAPKLKKEHGFIDWSKPASDVANLVRGLWPWPGAAAVYVSAKTGKSWRVTIASCQIVADSHSRQVCGMMDDNFYVICGRDKLMIHKVKPAGSALMDFQSFINGRQGGKDDLFLPLDMVLRDFSQPNLQKNP